MQLTNIGMINWHTYGAIDIKIEGDIIGVVGDNGSGKSTLLDALHVILTGGSERNMNKRAQGKSSTESPTVRRSIHSYSLGRLNEKTTLRTDCTTYLLAGFEDPAGKKAPVTLLMAFHSSNENTKTHLEARVVVRGALLKTTDILESDDASNQTVLPWSELRSALDKKVTATGGLLKTFPQTKKEYVQAYMQAMMYRGHYEGHNQYLSNLENAIALKEVKSATDFVQDYVLREGPIDIHSLRSTAVTFNKLVDHLNLVKSQIVQLEDLIVDLDKKREAERSEAVEKTLKIMSEAMLSRRSNRKQIFTIASRSAEKDRVEKELEAINRECAILNSNIDALKKRKYEMGNASLIQLLKKNISDFRRSIDNQLHRLLGEQGIGRLAHSIRYRLQSTAPDSALLPAFVKLNEAVNGTGTASYDYLPVDLGAADAALRDALSAIKEHLPVLKEHEADHIARGKQLKAECSGLKAQIDDIEANKVVRDPALDKFVTTLLKAGVEADVLCEVAEIVDEEWRDAIERLLGRSRDTVFVSEKGYSFALKMLDENQADFRKITLATTSKLLRHDARKRDNSVANILVSEHELAAAFIDFSYGNVQLAESREDFRKDGRWLTRSGLFESGISSRVLEHTHSKIGKNGLLNSLPLLNKELEGKQAELVDILSRQNQINLLISALTNFETVAGNIENVEVAFSSAKSDIAEKMKKISEHQDDIAAKEEDCDTTIIDEEIEAFHEDLKDRVDKQNALKLKSFELGRDIQDAQKLLGGSVTQIGSNAHMSAVNQTYRVTRVGVPPHIVKTSLGDLKTRWNAEGGLKDAENALSVIRKQSDAKHRQAQDYLTKTAVDTKTKIGAVLDNLSGRSELPEQYSVDDHLYPWSVNKLDELKNHQLIEYEDRFAEIKKEADDLFKSGFLNALAAKFDEVETQINSLNAVIRNTEFLGEKYKIKKKQAPGREAFHTAVKHVNEINNAVAGGGLLMAAVDPETTAAMDEIKQIIFSSDEHIDLDEFTDYRKYFTFDLEITNERTGVKNSLDSRKATGSGGEVQTPYYICILAAMSNVYYGGPFKNLKKDEGGLCLAIFDEAFSNMDEKVTGQVIDLGRQLGLQMIICGPSNKKITMQRNCKTVLTVVKSADARSTRIFAEHIKPKVRAELIALDPALKTDEEIALMMPRTENA